MSFRVLLVYAPALESPSEAAAPGRDPDRLFVPYGLLTTAAELRAHGFDAEVLNLSTLTVGEAAAVVRERPAELVGLSCFTFHRHAAAALGAEIKRCLPECHLTAGGPHVSALPREWLAHYPAFDSVVVGEGETTAVELAEHVRDGRPIDELPGTASRSGDSVAMAPCRPPIADLDAVARPWDHFDYGFLVTSRGCPGRCTFCSSPKLWGRKARFRSAGSVLEELEELVVRRGHRFLNVKDDTFTASKRRAAEICRGIAERGLVFRWACDTRADLVDAELLAAMRRAGCVRLNLGVESASAEVLRQFRKGIDPARVREVTRDARDLGLDVRYYLIVGGRGETPETIRETLRFVEESRPTHCLFHGLSVHPGTEDFEIAREQGLLGAEDYFDPDKLRGDFFPLCERSAEMEQALAAVARGLLGSEQVQAPYTTADRERILARHPGVLVSYTDLAVAYAHEWRLDEAERVLRRAGERFGAETPEILHALACVAFARRDFAAAEACFRRALSAAPNDASLVRDWQIARASAPAGFDRQGQAAQQLFANLRSMEFLYLDDGARRLVVPLSHAP
jgi:anaerobic magnesium-protoporphyrin IX monomethyl ester cyclase